MRLDTRVKRLEDAQGDSAQNGDGYDQEGDYRNHIWYMLGEDGQAMCVASMYDDHSQFEFACEEDLWKVYPAGTKFLRSAGKQNHEFIDGQMRELHFPPLSKERVSAVQAVVDSVMSLAD